MVCPLCVRYNQACLRPRDRFWDIPAPKIDSAFDNLICAPAVLVTKHYATTSQARCCSVLGAHMTGRRVRRPTLFSLWRKARRENSAASRLLGTTCLRFALHGCQRWPALPAATDPCRPDQSEGDCSAQKVASMPPPAGKAAASGLS
ncbi:hypothetical protein [Thiolapillus sp.]|uniref:hypothetical protein n=1 Tax=Thiolapillus sp. TaxID=2017437 RepID=UPI003AF8CE4C